MHKGVGVGGGEVFWKVERERGRIDQRKKGIVIKSFLKYSSPCRKSRGNKNVVMESLRSE